MPSTKNALVPGMPPRTRSKVGPEPPVMSWGKAARILAVTFVFDVTRLMFQWFWLFSPALAGTVAGFWLSTWLPDPAAAAIGAGVAGASGFFLFAAFAGFGVIMAMAVGFLGWLTMGILLLATNFRIFKTNATAGLWMLASLAIAETPFIGSIPSLTITTWRLYHNQIKREKAAHRQWKAANDHAVAAQRAERMAQAGVPRARVAQAPAQAPMANDNEEIPREGAVAA